MSQYGRWLAYWTGWWMSVWPLFGFFLLVTSQILSTITDNELYYTCVTYLHISLHSYCQEKRWHNCRNRYTVLSMLTLTTSASYPHSSLKWGASSLIAIQNSILSVATDDYLCYNLHEVIQAIVILYTWHCTAISLAQAIPRMDSICTIYSIYICL